GSRRSSAGRTWSPAPTAASPLRPPTALRSTRRSSGPSSNRWPKAPVAPRSGCGSGKIAPMRIENRLAELGLELPQPMKTPSGLELPFPWVRLWPGRAFVSGHGPLNADGSLWPGLGKVGADLTAEQAYGAARATALAVLASLQRAL